MLQGNETATNKPHLQSFLHYFGSSSSSSFASSREVSGVPMLLVRTSTLVFYARLGIVRIGLIHMNHMNMLCCTNCDLSVWQGAHLCLHWYHAA